MPMPPLEERPPPLQLEVHPDLATPRLLPMPMPPLEERPPPLQLEVVI